MPLHDWTLARTGGFQALHSSWIIELFRALNDGILPENYYAAPEMYAVGMKPDVLTFQYPSELSPPRGGMARVASPTLPRRVARFAGHRPLATSRRVAVRGSEDDRLVAMIEIVSPGNKAGIHDIRSFVRKVLEYLELGIHVLIVDLHAPGPRDPAGVHNLIWRELDEQAAALPSDGTAILTSFDASDSEVGAYVAGVAVGDVLPPMPLFLAPGLHVQVPLETTYTAAFTPIPPRLLGPLAGSR